MKRKGKGKWIAVICILLAIGLALVIALGVKSGTKSGTTDQGGVEDPGDVGTGDVGTGEVPSGEEGPGGDVGTDEPDEPGTLRLTFEEKQYAGKNGVLTLPIRSGVRIDVNAQEYTVKVSPRITEETEGMYYFKSGTATYFSEWGDLTKAFGITKHSGYFTVGEDKFDYLSSTSFWNYLSAQLFTGDKSGGNVAEKVDYHEIPCFWLEVTSGSETVRVVLKLD